MNDQSTAPSGANGYSTAQDIFMLSDEQILEIEPEPQDDEVSADVRSMGRSGADAGVDTNAGEQQRDSSAAANPQEPAVASDTNAAAPFSTPDDVRAIAELYPGGLNQAKTAAERARLLDDIDRAYFGAQASSPEQARASRAQLAAMMMREDPAAFREMVFEGLRALEATDGSARTRSIADAFSPAAKVAPVAPPLPAVHPNQGTSANPTQGQPGAQAGVPAPPEQLAAYSAFERAANADLEKSVGGAIERALQQALPNAGSQQAAPLQARLSEAIRQDVEKALQGDRQLGQQVAQILASRRLDDATRAQVVRLIHDRAQQLVPGAAKRALNDWTQATLAAHRSKTARSEAAASRREVTPTAPASRDGSASRPREGTTSARVETRAPSKGRVNYGKLSDEQILDL